MDFELSLFNQDWMLEKAVEEVLQNNEVSAAYGLCLTQQQAAALVETRSRVLNKTGRIEFGGGIIDKLIAAFCDSPYITKENYEETLHDLLELFYEYKNETHDLIGDDELIQFMRVSFNGICHGALTLLSDRELVRLVRELRFGSGATDMESTDEEEAQNETD